MTYTDNTMNNSYMATLRVTEGQKGRTIMIDISYYFGQFVYTMMVISLNIKDRLFVFIATQQIIAHNHTNETTLCSPLNELLKILLK